MALSMRSPLVRLLLAAGLLAVLPALAPGTGLPDRLDLPDRLLDARGLQAQVVERERQEFVLPASNLREIDVGLRNRLGLFPEVQGFRTARLFVRSDGSYLLEIEVEREGRMERERRPMDAARLGAFREDLQARLAETPGIRPEDHGGRGGLVLSQTLLGVAYHGWAVPVALDISSDRTAVATYLLTAGASFYLPYRLTRGRAVSEAHRDLAFFGNTRGILAGLLLGDILAGEESSASDWRLGGGVIAGWSGGLAGYLAAERFHPDPGTAALWTAMGDMGLAAGAMAAYAFGPYATETVVRGDPEFPYTEERRRNTSLGHGITLAGGVGGLAAGAWLGDRIPMTEGNVTVLRSAALLGAQTGLSVASLVTDDGRAGVGGALAGGIAGLALGAPWLSDRNFTSGEGLLIAAGHLGGGATSLGLTYLLVGDPDDHESTYLIASTLGSALGAGLVARALDPGSQVTGFSMRRGDSRAGGRGVSLEVHPVALVGSLGSSSAAPLVTIRF
jgi:hypothetical protein